MTASLRRYAVSVMTSPPTFLRISAIASAFDRNTVTSPEGDVYW